jgi:ABC-type Fe3+-hydroxamate transport system substrate-binding protein
MISRIISSYFRLPAMGPRRLALAACAIGALLASCSDRSAKSDGEPARGAAAVGSDAIRMRDAIGRDVVLERPARRVVSLAPSLTEILFAIGAGDAVVGRTTYCNYPPEARSVPVVSDMSTPNYERLVALKPDLLLLTFVGNSNASYDRLVDLGLRPFALSAQTIPGTLGAIDTIGALVGHSQQARELSGTIAATIDSIGRLASGRAPVSAFIVLDRSPLMTVSGGFINEALAIAGGRNIAAGDPAAYPRYSREEVLRRNPHVIIVPSDSAVTSASLLASFPEWRDLDAVRLGRIRSISPDILFRPGPRLGRSVVALYEALHDDPR